MTNPPSRANPELLLKLTHLRGAINELMLRNGPRIAQLRQSGADATLADEIAKCHQELGARIAEFEIVIDGLRRRSEEQEQVALETLGTGRVQIESEKFDVRDLESIVMTLRRTYDAILYAKAPMLPLDRLFRLDEFSLLVHLSRQEGALTLHLKTPLLESIFVHVLIDVARAIGIGEKPGSSKAVPMGWGPALMHVRRLVDRSLLSAETHADRVQESLDSIRAQFDDQLSPLTDPASLGLPLPALRTVAELLAAMILDLKERGHVQVLRLSSPYDEIFLLDEIGRELRGPDGRPVRDVVREKIDRYIAIPNKEPS